jgi:predicted hydrocarbon binding protein
MYELINKLRLARQLTFEEGQITLLGKPTVMMIPAETLMELQNGFLQSDPLKLYEIGKHAGLDFHGLISQYAHDAPHIMKFGVQVFNLSGFGKLETVQLDYDNCRGIFYIKDSVFAKVKSETPVCHYIRGMLTGFMQKTISLDIEGVEKSCMSQGHQLCEFILQKKGAFDASSEIVKKQLNF